MRILVADKLAEEGLDFLKGSRIAFDVKVGLKEDQLAAEVGGYEGLIVRSGAKVTAKVLEKPGKLRVIARAGVGVDNIDLPAATAKGVLVLNTAEASTISTAEHALALMFSLARKTPQADKHVRSGEWKRNLFQGTQLAGKTLGVVGLGRIGRTVATRALAMEMDVIGFDPFINAPTAMDGKVRVFGDFDEFLGLCDVITFHVPGSAQTRHLLNSERLNSKCRPNLLVINDARGEVVDEFALAEALRNKKIAGAAIDVYVKEPPEKDHPLFALDNVVLTPHLGASTDEAQTAVSTEACKAVVAYLQRGEIRGAVNAGGIRLDLPADQRAFADLARRGAMLLNCVLDDGVKSVTLRVHGSRPSAIATTLLRLATVELLAPHLDTPINVINVEHLARTRGISLVQLWEEVPPSGLTGDVIELSVEDGAGHTHRILGTVYADNLPRIVRVDHFSMDIVPEGPMTVLINRDKPGVIGLVGTAFGDASVNIADMAISRGDVHDGSERAMMVIKSDTLPTEALVDSLGKSPAVISVRSVAVPPL